MTKISSVNPKDLYKLEVNLENGNQITLDFSNKLQTVRFGLLSDKSFFKEAVTDGDLIKWGNVIEISAREVFQLAER